MPTTRQSIIAIAVLAVLLVPSVFFAKSASSRDGSVMKQITQQLRRAAVAAAPLVQERANPTDRAFTKGMATAATALERANALTERALKRGAEVTAIRPSYERALGVTAPLVALDEAGLRELGKSTPVIRAVVRLRKHVRKGIEISQKLDQIAMESERRTATSGEPPAAPPITAGDNAPSIQPDPERKRALQDPLFTYLSVDIPDRLKVQAGAGYESPDLLGGLRLTPTTPICPQCEGAIILSVVTTTETDADLAKYPIVLNGKDFGAVPINGITWRHFTLEGKSGPYEVYAVIRGGQRYSIELFSSGLWSEQDRAGIAGYDAAAARSFADDFSRIARSARILR